MRNRVRPSPISSIGSRTASTVQNLPADQPDAAAERVADATSLDLDDRRRQGEEDERDDPGDEEDDEPDRDDDRVDHVDRDQPPVLDLAAISRSEGGSWSSCSPVISAATAPV